METTVSKFYSNIAFPGHYSLPDLDSYGDPIENPYLDILEKYVRQANSVLDAGCGTGLTTNLFAYRNADTDFVGVDFSNSVDWARDFAQNNSINNVTFVKDNLVEFNCTCTFDLVVCQGVLHHIPEYKQALSNLKSLVSPGGRMILGLYHPWGKLAKQVISIDYDSDTLYQDQENNPFELAFSKKQVKQLTQEFNIVDTYPSLLSNVALPALFNYRNGGLVVYVLERKNYDMA